MTGGETHTFSLRLAQGQFSRVIVEQQGIDVALKLKEPDGQLIIEVDSPNGLHGPEAASVIAQLQGDYILEVRSDRSMPTGSYELRVEGPREPTSADLNRVAAERLFSEAQKLRFQSMPESRKQAIEKYKESLALWEVVGDAHGRAYTVCNIGRTYRALGNITEAIAHLQQSLSILREAKDVAGQAWILNEIGAVYRISEDPAHALEHYARALDLRRSTGDQWGEAQILNNVGLSYSYMGYQHKALENYQLAMPLWQATQDRYNEANTLNNIGLSYTELGDLSFAHDNLEKALKLSQAVGNKRLEAYVLNNKGRVYDTWADAQSAFRDYDAALKLFRELGQPDGEALVLNNFGMLHAGLADPERALEHFNAALAIQTKLPSPEPRGLGMTYTNIGYAHTIQHNDREALKYFDLALPLSRKAGNRSFIAYALLSKGLAHSSLGEMQEALEFYKQALDLQNEMKDVRGQAITLDGIGQVYAAMGQPSQAMASYEQSLRRWILVGDKQGEAISLYDIARGERDLRNLTSARDKIEEAIRIVESLRSNMTGHQLRMTYFAGKQNFYALAIDIRMSLYELTHSESDMEMALSISERARARNLLDLLVQARTGLNKGMSAPAVEKSRQLDQEISSLAQGLIRLRSSQRTEDAMLVENRLRQLTNEYDDLQARASVATSSHTEVNRRQPLSVREIQELLDGETLLLEYALGEERSYVWLVTRSEIKRYVLPTQAEIEATTLRLRMAITAYEPPKKGENNLQYWARQRQADIEYRQQSLELSRLVLGPVYSQLGNKRLVIVPDGALQYIPFEALPRPVSSGRGQSALRASENVPLILANEIVYLPSASALALLRSRPRSTPTKTVAVIADPVFNSEDRRVQASVNRIDRTTESKSWPSELRRALRDVGDIGAADTDFRLERLEYSAAEANAITAAAPPGSWAKAVNFDASRATVLNTDLGRFKIVHFATHGILNAKNPELSGVVLSMVNENGQPEDGFLSLRDIFNLNLPVDLVVLSACRTGIGKQVRGEGLMGLTRGFMYAGSARVVASLWKVDDEATSELMKRFYRYMLKKRMSAATALRQARVDLMGARDQWRSPFYWAGFILQGDWK